MYDDEGKTLLKRSESTAGSVLSIGGSTGSSASGGVIVLAALTIVRL